MDVSDLKDLTAEVKKRMDTQLDHVRREFSGVRTGRASVTILDTVHVEAYGSHMPLNQVASLSIPEPTLIVAQPFDPVADGGDREGDPQLEPRPESDQRRQGGAHSRFPSLTEERRKELSKLVHKYAEEGRNGVRQVRRDANDRLKKLLKDHKISEDDERRGLDDVQKITDQHVDDDRRPAEEEGRMRESCCGQSQTGSCRIFTHLECSAPCGAGPLRSAASSSTCAPAARPCSPATISTRRAPGRRASLAGRAANMWRYRELMPLFDGESPITLGEGWTPLIHATRLGADLGLSRLFVKDESLNPTNSFKARGLSAAVTRAARLGARVLSVPSAGNAANAMAAYAAAAGIPAKVFMPRDVKVPFIRECELYGADVTLVDGLITDAGRIAAETRQAARLVRRLDAQGAVPHRGQEDDGLRARGAARLADCPTGSSIRPAAAPAWSACGKRSTSSSGSAGSRRQRRPRMVSVQAEHCAPIVRAFEQGAERSDRCGQNARTIADGLRVPKAIGDFLVLRAVRESGGTALAVTDAEMVAAMRELGSREGISAAPEGGAALQALKRLMADGPRRARRHRGAVQHRRRAEISRRAVVDFRAIGCRGSKRADTLTRLHGSADRSLSPLRHPPRAVRPDLRGLGVRGCSS